MLDGGCILAGTCTMNIYEHWSRSKLQSGSHFTSGIPSKVFTPNLHPCFAIFGYVWFMNVCEYEIVHLWEIVGGSKMLSWYCASLNICLTVTVTIIEAELLLPVATPPSGSTNFGNTQRP